VGSCESRSRARRRVRGPPADSYGVNIFVGVLNMLPMLPLDGGYVAIATYERLRSKRGLRYHADVNKMAPFIYAFMGVLLVLFASTLFLDIAHPIAQSLPLVLQRARKRADWNRGRHR